VSRCHRVQTPGLQERSGVLLHLGLASCQRTTSSRSGPSNAIAAAHRARAAAAPPLERVVSYARERGTPAPEPPVNRALFVTLLWIEAAVCFGPLFLVLLLGVMFFPLWASMVISGLIGTVPWEDGAGATMWDAVWPMIFVLCGLVGVIGLVRTLLVLSRKERPLRRSLTTVMMIAVGLLGLISFDVRGGGFPSAIPALLVYYVLPGIGSAHLLYLAREVWLPTKTEFSGDARNAGT